MNKKGQAAMEYLMTYGWALLVIVIVIAILVLLNLKPPQQCLFDDSSIRCDTPLPVVSGTGIATGQLYATIKNEKASTIAVYGVSCTNDKVAPGVAGSTVAIPAKAGSGLFSIPANGQVDLTTAAPYSFNCAKIVGTGAINKGDIYQGKIYIFFADGSDPATFPLRTATATVVAQVS